MANSMQNSARELLQGVRYGLLSTHCDVLAGYPYGSLVPFVMDAEGRPVILISRLAQHNRNIKADQRVSLTVHAPLPERGADLLNTPRLCLLADAEECNDDVAREAYLQCFPQARDYVQLDFEFFRLAPLRIHLIAGFGKVQWLEPE